MELSKEYVLVNIFKCVDSFFDIYCRSKDMADFPVLQDKLKPLTLTAETEAEAEAEADKLKCFHRNLTGFQLQ